MKINPELSIKTLVDFGFKKTNENEFLYFKNLYSKGQSLFRIAISFNMKIFLRNNFISFEIDVLDEDFGQPYDYQWLLEQENPPKVAVVVKEKVEEILLRLLECGILSEYVVGEYV